MIKHTFEGLFTHTLTVKREMLGCMVPYIHCLNLLLSAVDNVKLCVKLEM